MLQLPDGWDNTPHSGTDQTGRHNVDKHPFVPTGNAAVDTITPTVLSAEGYAPRTFDDYGHASIGYGTFGRPGEQIDQPTAARHAQDYLLKLDRELDQHLNPNVSLTPGQRGALLSLAYNIKGGFDGMKGVLADVNRGDMAAAQQHLAQYKNAGGSALGGLLARRYREAAIFGGQPDPGQDAANKAAKQGHWPTMDGATTALPIANNSSGGRHANAAVLPPGWDTSASQALLSGSLGVPNASLANSAPAQPTPDVAAILAALGGRNQSIDDLIASLKPNPDAEQDKPLPDQQTKPNQQQQSQQAAQIELPRLLYSPAVAPIAEIPQLIRRSRLPVVIPSSNQSLDDIIKREAMNDDRSSTSA